MCDLRHAKTVAHAAFENLNHAKPGTHAAIGNLNVQHETDLISTVSSSIRARSRCKSAAASASCLALVLHHKASCEPCRVGASAEMKQIAHDSDAGTTREMEPWLGS